MAYPVPLILGLLGALTGAGATNFAIGAGPADRMAGPSGQGVTRTPLPPRSPDTPYASLGTPSDYQAANAASNRAPSTLMAAPKATPKPASKPTVRPPAKQGTKASAPTAPQKLATATPMAPPAQEDPFTRAQRMVNGTEQIPASAVAPVSDPVEDRYQLLLKMYGIGQPAADPYTEAQRMLNGTEASLGKIKDPNAALQYYGGDQAVYDALARMYGW